MTDVICSFQRCTRSQVQHSRLGEMISDPGNHSFNYIFCSLFSSPLFLSFLSLSSSPLLIHLFLASVYGQTFVTLPSSLWLPLSLSLCEAMETGFFCSVFLSTSFSFAHPTSHSPSLLPSSLFTSFSTSSLIHCMLQLCAKLHQNDKCSHKWLNGDKWTI